MNPDDLERSQRGAAATLLLDYTEEWRSKRAEAVIQRACHDITSLQLTPDRALRYWYEIHAVRSMAQDLARTSRQGRTSGERIEKLSKDLNSDDT